MRAFLLSALLLTAACSDEATSTAPNDAIPTRFYSEAEPAGAKPVADVYAAAKDGERVVLVGSVGGAAKVFVDGAAVFTLVDPSLASCVGDGMGCATPWDYCCEDPDAMRKGTATIELREGAQVIGESPQGWRGLDHLSTVVVAGVAERDASGNLVVAAEQLHVRK